MRDLVRAREDLRMDLMRARHRLGKFLLRHEIRFEGPGKNWSKRHLDWLAKAQLRRPRRAGHLRGLPCRARRVDAPQG